MNETTLLRTAIATGLIGIIILFIISRNSMIAETHTYDITSKHNGKDIRIKGAIRSVKETEKLLVLEVYEEKPITVIAFKGGKKHNLSEGSKVSIFGTAESYNGKMQVIAESIN